MDKPEQEVLERDPWFSRVFGYDVFRINATQTAAVDRAVLEGALQHAGERLFAYAKVDVQEVSVLQTLQSAGFRLADTNVTFEKTLERPREDRADGRVRAAGPDDEDGAVRIAAGSFQFTRFHLDPAVPDHLSDRIKEEWVKSYFRGQRGDAMLVVEENGEPKGFTLLLNSGGPEATVDLIAVAQNARRKGLARAMMTSAEVCCPAAGLMRVGTQLANMPSIRLYEGLGYHMARAEHVLHLHVNPKGGGP